MTIYRPYKRLNFQEREEISRSLAQGFSLGLIAKQLNRYKSTISREIGRLKINRYEYRAQQAQDSSKRKARRRKFGKYKLLQNKRLWNTVMHLLRKCWSPEQIANRLKEEYPLDKSMHISPETIYSYLYVRPKGELKKELLTTLRRTHKRRYKKGAKNAYSCGRPPDMTLINERPKDISARLVPGHWEGDLILGRKCQSMLGTLVERKTRYLMLVRLKNKRSEEVRIAFAEKVKQLPKRLRQTLTYDQGAEMAQHKQFTIDTGMKVYFAHPQSPWERGSNENTNGLLRQFFPKGTNFNEISEEKIQEVEYLLNDRPRKTLMWKKPAEAFNEVLH